MNPERDPGSPGETPFTSTHAAELRAMLEADRAPVPSLSEKPLPGFEHSPRELDPIEYDQQYQTVMASIEPIRSEADSLQDRYRAYIYARSSGQPSNMSQEEIDVNRARHDALRQQIRQAVTADVTPILSNRLPSLSRLPMYYGAHEEIETKLDLRPGLTEELRIDYGAVHIDLDRAIATPSHNNWAGYGYRKGTVDSSDKIVSLAIDMIVGDYDESTPTELPVVVAATDRHGNYVYLAHDGTHRLAAAKLLGRRTLGARVYSYNYTHGTPGSENVDYEQQSHGY
jgi:hypothetical protein